LGYIAATSKLFFVILAAVLITSLTSVPAIRSQPPTQIEPQSTATDVSQVVKQIAERVASANPGTNIVFVEQILTELARQSAQVSSRGNILEEIYSQVLTYPYGIESLSLARFASLLSSDTSILLSIVQKIIQEQASGSSPSQSIVNIAVQDATGGGKNVNDEITLAAQIIAKQAPNIPLRNIESIIIQMALEISRAQGKAITGQTIYEIASQIKQNPNGVLTQAILQLVKQDIHDTGKTGQTASIIKKVGKVVEYRATSDGEENTENKDGQTTQSPPPTKAVVPGPPPAKPTKILSPTDKWGIFRDIAKLALPPGWFPVVDKIVQQVADNVPPGFSDNIEGTILDIGLRLLNNAGPQPAFQSLTNLQSNIQTNPNLIQKVGQLAALYQGGDDIPASSTSEVIANKLIAGVEPAIAIEQTPIPEPGISFTTDQVSGQPFSTGELEAKSLPPTEGDTTYPAGNGTGTVEPDSPIQPLLIPEPTLQEESTFFPGLGVLSPQPDSLLYPSETALPTEPVTSPVEPSGTGLSQFFPASPAGLGTPAEIECLGSVELCTDPVVPSPSPSIDICQEQWYLPECTQNGNELEEEMSDAQPQAPDYDEGGYQQLPYYFEPEGYQEGEDQYNEDSSNGEDDYAGGYQEYEQDYSKEEDSGDEEDDYEEVGGYQEEEEVYSEEEVEENDSGEEEDFSEEEEESVEYSEE
jgi:hypothetical protein